MAVQKERPYAQDVDRLRQEIVRGRRVRLTAERLQLLKDVTGVWMSDSLRIDAEVKPGQGIGSIFGARQRPDDVEQILFAQTHERSPQESAQRQRVAPVGEHAG